MTSLLLHLQAAVYQQFLYDQLTCRSETMAVPGQEVRSSRRHPTEMIPMMAPLRAIVSVFLGKKDKIFTILKRGKVFDVIMSCSPKKIAGKT